MATKKAASNGKKRPSKAMGTASAVMAALGVIWTVGMYVKTGGPGVFPFMGVMFVFFAAVHAVYNFQNAGKPGREERERAKARGHYLVKKPRKTAKRS